MKEKILFEKIKTPKLHHFITPSRYDFPYMNKAELATRIAEKLEVSKKLGDDFIALFEELVTRELANGGEVVIAGFGTFSRAQRPHRSQSAKTL